MVCRVSSFFRIDDYRFGFNGQEKDNEVKGSGNSINYQARIQDPRLGRFLSVDPLTAKFPMLTPYQFASNDPIESIDIDGQERLDYRLVRNDDGTTELTLLSVGPTEEESIWGNKKIPLHARVEYNGEHYFFAPKQNQEEVRNQTFNTPIGTWQDFGDFIQNPQDGYSQEDASNDFKTEVLARALVANVSELTNYGMSRVNNYIFAKASYRMNQRLAGIKSRQFPDLEVRYFGSRVSGTNRVNSDLDVLVVTENAAALRPATKYGNILQKIKEDYTKSTGVKVDLNIMTPEQYRKAKDGAFRQTVKQNSKKVQ